MDNKNDGKIESLQALRGIAFLGIFLLHVGATVSWAAFGVSIFFVMSGFLMTKRYNNQGCVSIKSNAKFAIQKIKKIYPLHIITMLFALALQITVLIIDGEKIRSFISLLGKTVINTFLLQAWIPSKEVVLSLNGISWFLSVMIFLYFAFPFIMRIINKCNLNKLIVISVLLLVLQIISCFIVTILFAKNSYIYQWFTYCFPVFRVGDFFAGCVLCVKCNETKTNNRNNNKYSVIEVITFITTLIILVLLYYKNTSTDNIIFKTVLNDTTIYILLSLVWIYLFYCRLGIITKLLSNKALVYLGNISAYLFLIHYVVIQYVRNIMKWMNISLNSVLNVVLIVFELALSIALAILFVFLKERKKCLKEK